MVNNTEPSKQEVEEKVESEPSMLFWVCYAISTIIIITYCIKARTWEEIFKYSTYVAAVLASLALILLAYNIISSWGKNKSDWRSSFLLVLVFAVGICVGAITYYSIFVAIKDFALWIISPSLSKTSAAILSVIVTLTIGLLLFYFRLKARAIYGLTEATVGLIVSVQRVIHEPEQIITPEFYFAILTAAIYLFVRGVDNIHQGLTKEPIDPYGSKIYNFLRSK